MIDELNRGDYSFTSLQQLEQQSMKNPLYNPQMLIYWAGTIYAYEIRLRKSEPSYERVAKMFSAYISICFFLCFIYSVKMYLASTKIHYLTWNFYDDVYLFYDL